MKKLNEECYELLEAISNYNDLEPFSGEQTYFKSIFKEHVAEEIADCLVLIKQFQLYYDISQSEINKIIEHKVDRTLKRINENYYEKKEVK